MRSSTRSRRLSVAWLGAALVVAIAAPTPATAQGRAPVDYGAFLDSLRASSPPLSREGVRDAWAAADSAESVLRERGVAAADSLDLSGGWRPRLEFLPAAFTTFNRVEGFRPGAGIELDFGPLELRSAAAYGIANEVWRHRHRLKVDLPNGHIELGFRDAVERYGALPVTGNAAYALIGGADDQDYLGVRAAHVALNLRLGRGPVHFDDGAASPAAEVTAGFEVADETSVAAVTDWNLFQRRRGPRPNPPISAGEARRVFVEVKSGWSVAALRQARMQLRATSAWNGSGLGGDFDYHRHLVEWTADMRSFGRDDFRLRTVLGAALNTPPRQGVLYLGGPDLLRAYPVHGLRGDRALAASIDYHLGTDILGRLGLDWAKVQFIPFAEIGAAWFDAVGRRTADWRGDVGLGLQRNVAFGASVRSDFAARLDRDQDRLRFRFSFRLPLFAQ